MLLVLQLAVLFAVVAMDPELEQELAEEEEVTRCSLAESTLHCSTHLSKVMPSYVIQWPLNWAGWFHLEKKRKSWGEIEPERAQLIFAELTAALMQLFWPTMAEILQEYSH